MPFSKEPMFFSHDENFERGLPWYSKTFFKGSGNYSVRGDASPHYLYWSEKTAPRIKDAFKESPVKFIVALRDPVARAYSWYGNMLKDGVEDLSFEQALDMEDQRLRENRPNFLYSGSMKYGYFRGSCYTSLLAPFLDLFPIQDFKFILQEESQFDHDRMSRGLLSYLGVDTTTQLQPIRSNVAAMPYSNKLHSLLRRRSKVKEILKLLIPIKIRYKLKVQVMQLNLKPVSFQKMKSETENSLRERFLPEILELQKITGRDLSGWMK
jgi:hypothetical protein